MRYEDEIDARLMRELGSPDSFRWNARESYARIAKRLGVDEETVRYRLRRAEESGVLRGYILTPNPRLFNMEASVIELESGIEKQRAISKISLVEGVVLIMDFHGRRMRVVFYHYGEDALARKVRLILSISESKGEVHWTEGFPPCTARMKNTDWRIFGVLRKDPRQSLAGVAERVGVSTRTVKRRVEKMTDGRVFFLEPLNDYQRSAVSASSYTVRYSDPGRKSDLDAKISAKLPKMIASYTASPEYSVFTMLSNNVSEADATTDLIEGMEGVGTVSMGLVKGVVHVSGWLDDEIRRRASQ